jgi:hypothetical protein
MRRLVAIMLVLGIAGCVTPSIPIPPPDPAKMTFHLTTGAAGTHAVFSYPPTNAYVGGVAYIYNESKGVGVIQSCGPDGSIGPTQEFLADAGNQIVVSVQVGQQTESQCIVLREGTQDPTQYCQ